MNLRPFFALVAVALVSVLVLRADPLTKEQDLDFGRDVASRHLKGLATRSDGRLLPGPFFTDLEGPKLGDILWSLKPSGKNRFLVGTGSDGKIQEVKFNPKNNTYSVREVADLGETHAMTLLPLENGDVLAGTSPSGALYLIRDDKIAARVPLPADSVFDLLPLPNGGVLVATGNPGKIYQLDLKKFAKVGVIEGKADGDKQLEERGLTLFGEIRDRNVRKLTRLGDGRIIAGSSPKGNIYSFSAQGGAPVFLQENRDAEVVDLLPNDDGSFYAALVFSGGDSQRLARSENKDEVRDRDAARPSFGGRSTVVRFPADGFPETVVSRGNVSLYRVIRHGEWLLLTAGEQGDTFGYDPVSRRSLTFAGSVSAQLNDIAPLGDGRYLMVRNNAPGLAVLSFDAGGKRQVETKRLDLNQAAELGALRFPRLRGIELDAIKVEASTNYGSDEIEGWSPWTELKLQDGGFSGNLRGRYVKYRLTLGEQARDFQIDKAVQYHLPQNRRPSLSDFRIFPPNRGIIPVPEPPGSAVSTLGQLLFPNRDRDAKDDNPDRRKGAFLNSQVIAQPGSQIVYWSVNDPDGDSLVYTFSIRPENSETWTELARRVPESYVQFETGGLPEGLYLTRLVVDEVAPRAEAHRLNYTFETDNLLVDRTPPAIEAATARREGGNLLVTVSGRDERSLLEGAEFLLNNGARTAVLHPADGILDGLTETFIAEFPEPQATHATSVEVILYDTAGNASSKRLSLK